MVNLYDETLDLSTVLSPEQIEQYKQNQLSSFGPGLAVFLSIISFGWFNNIYYQLQQDKLPQVKPDDPSGGKALAFVLIPYLNIFYGIWVMWPRYIDRINFQLRLRGRPPVVTRSSMITTLILCIVIVGLPLALININKTQKAINELAAERGV
jgi:hypothetical protein